MLRSRERHFNLNKEYCPLKLVIMAKVPLVWKLLKDVRGWQFLTMKDAEILCIVCLPPEKTYFLKKYLGNRPSKKITFYKDLTIKFAFLRIF